MNVCNRTTQRKATAEGLEALSMRGYIIRYLQQYPELLDLVANDTVESSSTRYNMFTVWLYCWHCIWPKCMVHDLFHLAVFMWTIVDSLSNSSYSACSLLSLTSSSSPHLKSSSPLTFFLFIILYLLILSIHYPTLPYLTLPYSLSCTSLIFYLPSPTYLQLPLFFCLSPPLPSLPLTPLFTSLYFNLPFPTHSPVLDCSIQRTSHRLRYHLD